MGSRTLLTASLIVGALVGAACSGPNQSDALHGRGSGTNGGGDDGGTDDGGGADPGQTGVLPPPGAGASGADDPLAGLLTGDAQIAQMCARRSNDIPNKVFCRTPKPNFTSISDVLAAFGLQFSDPAGGNGTPGNPAFAITGHSSGLADRAVSAINPEAFVWSAANQVSNQRPFVAIGSVRGEQFVEVMGLDVSPNVNAFFFYLIRFQQACNTAKSCTTGDLLGPNIEKNWTGWTVYDDVDLANTTLDCLHCHQPGGPTQRRILRMQERTIPWTHWFRANTTGGQALLADFHAAHGNSEDYGGIPAQLIDQSDPKTLQLVMDSFGGTQPNEFPSFQIESEVNASAPGQPQTNVPAGASPTWDTIYEAAVQGRFIPAPYHDVKVTDATKLTGMTSAYQSFIGGRVTPDKLPDIRNVFLDSALPDLGFQPKAGLDGSGVLAQTCARCHNSRLDQGLSKSRFNVDAVSSMSRGEKDLAISRINLPPTSRFAMPPARFTQLTDEAKNVAIAYLQQ
jgi:hypothetical protein